MAADEIFILLLVIVSVGAVVALALHSRREKIAADSIEPLHTPEGAGMSEPLSTASEPYQMEIHGKSG